MTRLSIVVLSLIALGLGMLFHCSGGTINVGPIDGGSDGDADQEACPSGCPGDQICHEGVCVEPGTLCDDVSCPEGQQCYLGRCISGDLCAGVLCPNEGDICQHGECISGEADFDNDGVIAREDCDDRDPEIHPGASERCNGLDDDCDGAIDESFDVDGDGFPGCEATPEELRDCNDDSAWVFPGASEQCNNEDDDCDGEVDNGDPGGGEACGETVGACEAGLNHCIEGEIQCVGAIFPRDEICNGADDDCNGPVDDGDAVASCGAMDHATVGCVSGGCTLVSCDDGWADLNSSDADGCETSVDSHADLCASASALGNVPDDGTSVDPIGTIAPAGDVDWFTFVAQDTAFSSCETFNLTIEFITNPGNNYRFEVRRGDCGSGAQCGNEGLDVAVDLLTYDYSTDFYNDGPWGPEIRGECPCTSSPTPAANVCSDNGATYLLRVYRIDATYSGDQYHVRISNG